MDNENNNKVQYFTVTHGLTIKVRDTVYQQLLDMPEVTDNYDIDAKRLNRWWYSVGFMDKNKE